MMPSKLKRVKCFTRPEELVERISQTSPDAFMRFLLIIQGKESMILLQDDMEAITKDFSQTLTDEDFIKLLSSVKEILNGPPWVFIAVDNSPLDFTYARVNVNTVQTEEVAESDYAKFKEELMNGREYGTQLVPDSKLSEAIGSLLNHSVSSSKKKMLHVVIFSSHGAFLHGNILRDPRAGGQVINILEQVRDFEKSMLNCISKKKANAKFKIVIVTPLLSSAVGATRPIRLQKLNCAKHVSLLQIPNSLEELTEGTINVIDKLLQKESLDMIIGSDCDGNLRASLLAKHLGARQVQGDLAAEASWRGGPRMFIQMRKKIQKD